MRIATIFILIAASVLYSAPIPKKKEVIKAKQDFVGKYKLMWGGSKWIADFHGKEMIHTEPSESQFGSDSWDGAFSWDPATRTLYVQEQRNDPAATGYLIWHVTLDKDFKGTAQITNGSTIEVEFTRLGDK